MKAEQTVISTSVGLHYSVLETEYSIRAACCYTELRYLIQHDEVYIRGHGRVPITNMKLLVIIGLVFGSGHEQKVRFADFAELTQQSVQSTRHWPEITGSNSRTKSFNWQDQRFATLKVPQV